MGAEYLTVLLTALIAGASGCSWAVNKLLSRSHERVSHLSDQMSFQTRRINELEDQINRMPLDYVLKVDFLREIQQMHDNFKEINSKLDKMMDRILK